MYQQNFKRLFVLFTMVCILVLLACSSREEKTITTNSLPSTEAAVVPVPDTTIIKVSALKLSADYIANEVKADKEYKNRVLIVEGEVQEITRGVSGKIYVVLKGSNKMRSIFCDYNNEEKAALINKGETISFKGTCDGLMASVILNDCEWIK